MTYFNHRRDLIRFLALLCGAAALCAGVVAAVLYSARLELQKGVATLKRGKEKIAISAGGAPLALQVGDELTLQKDSSARISLTGRNAIGIDQKSSVVLNEFKVSPRARKVGVDLTLKSGKIMPAIYKPVKKAGETEKRIAEREEAWTYDFRTAVGKGVVSGASFVGEIIRETKKRYTVNARAGNPRVRQENLLIQLASAVTVDEGPPLEVTANPANERPILAAWVGSVMLVLQPGQSVQIEVTDTGRVKVTNLSADQPLYACEWDSLPVLEVPAEGGEAEFEVIETDVETEAALTHMGNLAGTIYETYPQAFPPEEVPPVEAAPLEGEGEDEGAFEELPRIIISPNE